MDNATKRPTKFTLLGDAAAGANLAFVSAVALGYVSGFPTWMLQVYLWMGLFVGIASGLLFVARLMTDYLGD